MDFGVSPDLSVDLSGEWQLSALEGDHKTTINLR